MVNIYNTKAFNQGLSEDEMHAYLGDFCTPPSSLEQSATQNKTKNADYSDPKFTNFDIAGVGLGFHHFVDPTYAAEQISARLRPGGVLFIIDFLPHEKLTHNHAAAQTVTHNGFSEEAIRRIFEKAGCGKNFALKELGDGVLFEGMGKERKAIKKHVFLARGTKE